MNERRWDLWVDFYRIDADGLTHASMQDVSAGVTMKAGNYVVVGDEDADPAVAQVVDIQANGVILLRVLPGPADQHLELLSRSSA